MSIRNVFIVSLLGIFGCTSMASANSCSNVDVMGSFDQSGLRESEFGIYAAGTFRIAGEIPKQLGLVNGEMLFKRLQELGQS